MMYLLTTQQKDLLVGQFFAPASMFNPVQDINGDWFISSQEVNLCINPDFQWVKNLTQMTYTPPPSPENRQQKVDVITSYMKSQVNDSQYISFLTDVRDYLVDYTFYSDSLYYWVGTTYSVEWGDYTWSISNRNGNVGVDHFNLHKVIKSDTPISYYSEKNDNEEEVGQY